MDMSREYNIHDSISNSPFKDMSLELIQPDCNIGAEYNININTQANITQVLIPKPLREGCYIVDKCRVLQTCPKAPPGGEGGFKMEIGEENVEM